MYMTLPWQLMLAGIQEDSEKTPHILQPAEDLDHQPGRRGRERERERERGREGGREGERAQNTDE